jgi:dihydroflavonol-4-reductase
VLARFDSSLRSGVGDLGEKVTYSVENARRRVGFSQRPIEETIVDCARSLIEHPAAAASSA